MLWATSSANEVKPLSLIFTSPFLKCDIIS
jgi:hypothetical protein